MIEPNRAGEVWVFGEQQDGVFHDCALELCGKARQLADELGVKAASVLVGTQLGKLPQRLIAQGVDNVYAVEDSRLGHYQTLPYARVLCNLIEKYKPQIVLFGATALGRDLAPRVASEMRAGMTADCTDLEIKDVQDQRTKEVHKNLLLQIRPAFGGNIIATIVNYDWWPQMATVREGVMPMLEPDLDRVGNVVREQVPLDDSLFKIKLVERHVEERRVNLKGPASSSPAVAGWGVKRTSA